MPISTNQSARPAGPAPAPSFPGARTTRPVDDIVTPIPLIRSPRPAGPDPDGWRWPGLSGGWLVFGAEAAGTGRRISPGRGYAVMRAASLLAVMTRLPAGRQGLGARAARSLGWQTGGSQCATGPNCNSGVLQAVTLILRRAANTSRTLEDTTPSRQRPARRYGRGLGSRLAGFRMSVPDSCGQRRAVPPGKRRDHGRDQGSQDRAS